MVTREISERPEGLEAGFSVLAGTDKQSIIDKVTNILDNFKGFDNQFNPYGNGDSSKKIADFISQNL